MKHILIVNETTFYYHLNHMFLGTGNKQENFDFLFNGVNVRRDGTPIGTPFIKNQIEMLNDVLRIKSGDLIVFFVTGISKFYGIFRARNDIFLDNNYPSHLQNHLGINLTNRFQIEPYEVYENGISEYEVLDKIGNIQQPQEMMWSLIYRKLKGNRGSTMIFEHEYRTLYNRLVTNNVRLNSPNNCYSYNNINKRIVIANQTNTITTNGTNIFNRNDISSAYYIEVQNAFANGRAFEHYLHGLLMNDLVSNNSVVLNNLGLNGTVTYAGNEVGCGVGMQRIDSLVIIVNDNTLDICLIEVKYNRPNTNDIRTQINRYINWIEEYLVPIFLNTYTTVNLTPVILAGKYTQNRRQQTLENQISNLTFTSNNRRLSIQNTRYFTFDLTGNVFNLILLV